MHAADIRSCSEGLPGLAGVQVALTMFYNTPAGAHASTFFNQTIDIVEVPPLVDVQAIFLLVALLALLAGAGARTWPHMFSPCPKLKNLRAFNGWPAYKKSLTSCAAEVTDVAILNQASMTLSCFVTARASCRPSCVACRNI